MADEPTRNINERTPERTATFDTRVVNDNVIPTRSGRTRIVPQGGRRMALGNLPPGTDLLGQYTVVETLRAHETLRPGVYLCDAKEQQVIVKIHGLNCSPDRELWKRIGSLEHPNVVRTLKQIEHDGLCYEILSYCNIGALADSHRASEPEVTDSLLPQIISGLHYLHEQGVVHRDIKPSNIFIQERNGQQQYLLGDFDISSQISSDYTQRVTTRAAGTWTYTAPEAFPRFQDEEGRVGAKVHRNSDYYSLGVTLFELLVGTTPMHHCKLPDLFDFYLTGERVKVPESVSARMRSLLQGLLIRDYHRRWGHDECQRWLANANTAEDLAAIEEDNNRNPFNTVQMEPYQFGDIKVHTPQQLAQAMVRNQKLAKEHLEHNDWLFSWLGRIDGNLTVKMRKEFREHITDPDIVTWCCCMFDPSTPLPFCSMYVSTLQEWVKVAEGNQDRLNFSREFLRLINWLEHTDYGEKAFTVAAQSIMDDRSLNTAGRLFLLQCLAVPGTLFELKGRSIGSAEAWVDEAETIVENGGQISRQTIDCFLRWLSMKSDTDREMATKFARTFAEIDDVRIALTLLRYHFESSAPIRIDGHMVVSVDEWFEGARRKYIDASEIEPIEIARLIKWLSMRGSVEQAIADRLQNIPPSIQRSVTVLEIAIWPQRPIQVHGKQVSNADEWWQIVNEHHPEQGVVDSHLCDQFIYWLGMHSDSEQELAQKLSKLPDSLKLDIRAIGMLTSTQTDLQVSDTIKLSQPSDIPSVCYSPSLVWSSTSNNIPDNYQSIFDCWQSGLLDLWLNRVGSSYLLTESTRLRNLKEIPTYSTFEQFLRIIDAKLPKVKLTITVQCTSGQTSFLQSIDVENGHSVTFRCHYATEGVGIPSCILYGMSDIGWLIEDRYGFIDCTVGPRSASFSGVIPFPVRDAPAVYTDVTISPDRVYSNSKHEPSGCGCVDFTNWCNDNIAVAFISFIAINILVILLLYLVIHL